MDDDSNSKKVNEKDNGKENEKETALRDLISQSLNGKDILEKIEDPLVLTLNLKFWLDKQKIKNYEPDKIVLYIIDCFLANSENLLPVAEKVKKEVMGKPRLIIPSGKLVTH